ncbi:Phage capsid scaffolding protein [Qipengyuania citrea LAMA 915]|uniref:Phage capsid scaffolding protein n=1 Tax=Qipengyuania citrea LAMA 915 TaxID=1306953 RepID=A0A0L1KFI7_9SPHN|nr:GPO family capsid scaffolding protein [Qipengyuania citrea]KNH02607.1 Phage capsid scaffolding protein [Qipengyuania citrea LAMA 915]
MKTKKFLLATAGSTVDGRAIDETMLTEMADGYDPKTYGARLNIEHIRGISGQSPFRAYGDVLELSVDDVDVNFHGETEKRKGLYGVFDVTDEAKELNGASQKVYPSIEIEPNFAGKGKAYLMGVALTDSPASVATERLAFNRSLPGALTLGADKPEQAFAIEFAEDDGTASQAGDSFLGKLGSMLDGFATKLGGATASKDGKPEAKPEDAAAAALDFSALRPLFEDMGRNFATQFGALQTQIAEQGDSFAVRVKAIEDRFETTPVTNYTARPAAAGAHGNTAKTDC